MLCNFGAKLFFIELTKLILIGKKYIAILYILVYLGGISGNFFIQSSHIIFHFITQTLHQHQIQNHIHDHHSHTHEHGHKHNHLIDQALDINDETKEQNQPEAPANNSIIKLNDHLSKSYSTDNSKLKALQKIYSPYSFILNEYSTKPLIPPPKYS